MIVNKKKKKNVVSKIFSFNLFMASSVLAVVFLGTGLGKEFYRDYQIKKEIDSLQNDINILEKDNYKLSQLIEYYKTDEYKEAEVRKRFNLKRDGESVVIVRPNPGVLGAQSNDLDKNDGKNKLPNYIKWWNYFFASK